ncbi:DUF6357 family protein [Streptomyces sp. NBC_01335]|uniref:DUF6357 family protein n=1 Tax=Streptomyces sp. NBC_01335 TaxID=2903828 RepID=UPI003FA34459
MAGHLLLWSAVPPLSDAAGTRERLDEKTADALPVRGSLAFERGPHGLRAHVTIKVVRIIDEPCAPIRSGSFTRED